MEGGEWYNEEREQWLGEEGDDVVPNPASLMRLWGRNQDSLCHFYHAKKALENRGVPFAKRYPYSQPSLTGGLTTLGLAQYLPLVLLLSLFPALQILSSSPLGKPSQIAPAYGYPFSGGCQ